MNALFCVTGLHIPIQVRRIATIFVCVATFFTSPVHALKAEDGTGYAHRICSLYEAPVEHATFAGGGAGCTWIVGDGERGVTSTEITMLANRNPDAAEMTMLTQAYETMLQSMVPVPGYRSKNTDIVCGNGNATGRMMFWGQPYSGNMYGYAICGNNILSGEIHYPPKSELDMEVLYHKLMQSMMPLLDQKIQGR
jgi:hypothetical protein